MQPRPQPKPSHVINEFVIEQIRRLRQEQGIKIEKMARQSGIALGSYSCLETSKYRMSLDNLFRCLQVLAAPVDQVWPSAGEEIPKPMPIDEGYIRRYVDAARSGRIPPVTVEDIIGLVCQEYDLLPEQMADPSRKRRVSEARTMAALLVREEGHLTQMALSRRLNRTVSSLSHCLRRLESRLESESGLAAKVGRMRRRLWSLKKRREGHDLKDVRITVGGLGA